MNLKTILPVLLLCTGCHTISSYPVQKEMTTKSTTTTVDVRVIWHKTVDSVNAVCDPNRTTYGCASMLYDICVIHAIEPDNFNDVPKLAILGHEFWHCLGARHK